jgi:hypothetical protein
MIAQLVRLALADASDLSDNVVLTNISEGVDGAAAMFYNAEDNSVLTTGAGDSLLNSQLHTIDIRALWGSAEQTKLYGWVTARTKLIATAYGLDGALVWRQPVLLAATEGTDNTITARVRMTAVTLFGYAPNGGKVVHIGPNLLRTFDVLNGTATNWYGFTASSPSEISRSGDTITYAPAGSATNSLTNRLFYPFPGERLAFGLTSANINTDCTVSLAAFNAAGSQISASSLVVSGTGAFTQTFTLPALTVSIQFTITVAGPDTAIVRLPFVAVPPVTTYQN